MTERSDIDILIDVAGDSEAEAWSFVEALCGRFRVPADIHSARSTQAAFLDRISQTARVLS
jgi:predicted nucleotidyltransferase